MSNKAVPACELSKKQPDLKKTLKQPERIGTVATSRQRQRHTAGTVVSSGLIELQIQLDAQDKTCKLRF